MNLLTKEPPSAPFEVPKPHRVERVLLSDGNVILLRGHGNPKGPRLLMSHGNGFAIDMYYPLWGNFVDAFEVIVFDLRNHGWNPLGDIADHNFPQIVKDLDLVNLEVQRRFGEKPTIGLYHSVSALAACLSESRGEEYAGLFLLDPPVCKPGITFEKFHDTIDQVARQTRRREVCFESLKQCAELFRWSPFYQGAVKGACQLAAQATLRWDSEARGFVLRCPRSYEALIVNYASVFTVLVDFENMSCPVKVLGADPTLPYAFLPSTRLDQMMVCSYDFVPNATHMLFLEQPEVCAARFMEFIEKC